MNSIWVCFGLAISTCLPANSFVAKPHERAQNAGAILYSIEDGLIHIVLGEEPRTKSGRRFWSSFVGENKDRKDSTEKAAKREIQEETRNAIRVSVKALKKTPFIEDGDTVLFLVKIDFGTLVVKQKKKKEIRIREPDDFLKLEPVKDCEKTAYASVSLKVLLDAVDSKKSNRDVHVDSLKEAKNASDSTLLDHTVDNFRSTATRKIFRTIALNHGLDLEKNGLTVKSEKKE